MTVVIGAAYCSYCESGDRGLTVVTVILVIRGTYSNYCDSGDRRSLL